MFIIHGNIKTMEERDFPDGYLEIADGKIKAVGDMKDCPETGRTVIWESRRRRRAWRGTTAMKT